MVEIPSGTAGESNGKCRVRIGTWYQIVDSLCNSILVHFPFINSLPIRTKDSLCSKVLSRYEYP